MNTHTANQQKSEERKDVGHSPIMQHGPMHHTLQPAPLLSDPPIINQ